MSPTFTGHAVVIPVELRRIAGLAAAYVVVARRARLGAVAEAAAGDRLAGGGGQGEGKQE